MTLPITYQLEFGNGAGERQRATLLITHQSAGIDIDTGVRLPDRYEAEVTYKTQPSTQSTCDIPFAGQRICWQEAPLTSPEGIAAFAEVALARLRSLHDPLSGQPFSADTEKKEPVWLLAAAHTTTAQDRTLERITTDLHASGIETVTVCDADVIADFRAMGHRFRFRIDAQGVVTEGSCHSDAPGPLARPEMEALRALAERELMGRGHGHLVAGAETTDVLCVLGRAEIKLALALQADEQLTGTERRELSRILEGYEEGVRAACDDPRVRRLPNGTLSAIRKKLGV